MVPHNKTKLSPDTSLKAGTPCLRSITAAHQHMFIPRISMMCGTRLLGSNRMLAGFVRTQLESLWLGTPPEDILLY